MVEHASWSDYASEHMRTRHGISPQQVEEALNDPGAIWADPDPTSITGQSVRVVGWCASRAQLLTVILLHDQDGWAGVNAWVTKSGRDRTAYRRTNND